MHNMEHACFYFMLTLRPELYKKLSKKVFGFRNSKVINLHVNYESAVFVSSAVTTKING